MGVRRAWPLASLVVVALLLAAAAEGAPGALDPSFGGGSGAVTTFVGSASNAEALVLQPDGKMVAVGDVAPPVSTDFDEIGLARYEANGTLDSSFGSGGTVTTSIPSGNADGNAAVLQPDGKIVVAGSLSAPPSGEQFFLVRYNPNGSLDTTFGTGGFVTTEVGDVNSEALAVLLQPDGKIVAGGEVTTSSGRGSALVRYLPDGSLDPSFGDAGIVRDTDPTQEGFKAIALQPDGKILGVGAGFGFNTPLTRFDSNGDLDTSFAGGGVANTPDAAAALALQPDGKIVVEGAGDGTFVVGRNNADGSLDESFGTQGFATTPVGAGRTDAAGIAVQPDGKILAAGTSLENGGDDQDDFTLIRYNANGSLDTTFGNGGIVTTRPSSWTSAATAGLALQPDGKIVLAGQALFTGWASWQFALARYLGSTLTVQTAGSGTGTVTSSPSGVSCSTTCTAPFAAVPVTLTATPSTGSTFTGWSGGGCSGTATCQVQMSSDQTVTATFSLAPETLTLTKSGKGSGTVMSNPAGLSCGATCAHSFTYGTTVVLKASAKRGSTFKGWSGACVGKHGCSVTMTQGRSISARFASKPACVVPKLKSKSLKTARERISRAHCRLGNLTHGFSKVKKGHVISQRPRAKRHLSNGAKVSLVVSKGRRRAG